MSRLDLSRYFLPIASKLAAVEVELQRVLRSDVAVGTSLSGGLDSSAIVAFCHQQKTEAYTHKCFTASFPGFEKDELHYAKQIANQFGLQHFVAGLISNNLCLT